VSKGPANARSWARPTNATDATTTRIMVPVDRMALQGRYTSLARTVNAFVRLPAGKRGYGARTLLIQAR
jgi:hypothetical protein